MSNRKRGRGYENASGKWHSAYGGRLKLLMGMKVEKLLKVAGVAK